MAPQGSKSPKQSAWERLQERFSRQPGDGTHYDEPQHRGLTIAICVLISVVLWFIFTMQDTYSVTIDLPTQVVGVPEGEALAQVPPDEVQAQVRGQGFSLLNLKYGPPTIPLQAGVGEINLEEVVPELPKNLELIAITPNPVRLRTEPLATRQIPVQLRADIQTPSTHDLLEPARVEPESIRVAGAASIVRNLDGWPTERVEVTGLKDSISALVPLADTLSGLVQRSAGQVRMIAVSRQFTEGQREIDVTVTGTPTTGEKVVTLDPSSVTVRYRVLFSDYEEAQQADDFFATVSYDLIRSDTTGFVEPRIHAPSEVTLRDLEWTPQSLRYYNFLD